MALAPPEPQCFPAAHPGPEQLLFLPGAPVLPSADLRLLEVTTMVGWSRVRGLYTAEELLSDPSLWRRMFFRNWDRIPDPLRERALARQLGRYRALIDRPESWQRLSAEDWDRVPQPVRAMAVLRMVERRVERTGLGQEQGLPRATVARRLGAIIMSESWFEHRAVSRSADGSLDVGLGQISPPARRVLALLFRLGRSDVEMSEDDYFNPPCAVAAAAAWFGLMLGEAGGDLDLATRAYNVGLAAAQEGDGAGYLEAVRRREGYMRDESGSPSWRFLLSRARPWRGELPPDASETEASRRVTCGRLEPHLNRGPGPLSPLSRARWAPLSPGGGA